MKNTKISILHSIKDLSILWYGLTKRSLRLGVLSIVQMLDYEHTKSYQLLVLATDQGVPPLSSQAVVNISVSDSNDNTPLFSQKTYSVQVSEDVQIGEIILKVFNLQTTTVF